MSSNKPRSAEAMNLFSGDKQLSAVMREKAKADAAEAAKTARLRALRLAKEAADREATASNTPAKRKKPAPVGRGS